MFVPCPHCQFLVAHHPQLRPLAHACPRCGRPLQDEGDAAAVDDGVVEDGAVGDAPVEVDAEAADVPLSDDDAATVAAAGADGSAAGGTAASADASASFARPRGTRHALARWRWPLIVLLGMLLALQILVADRARLAADPRWRPVLETLCGALRCELPAWHEPSAFTMLDRKVRPGQQPGALRVDATFRNDARWPQAWPALQLALSDADGHVLGSRVLLPADYLGAAPATRLSPGQSAQITFLVQEPAPGTVAFSFEFR